MQGIVRASLLMLLLICLTTNAEDQTTAVKRKFDEKKLEQLKNDNELKYEVASQGISFWTRLRIWLQQLIAEVIHTATTTDWTRILILVLIIIALLYIVMRVLQIDTVKIFYRNSSVAPPSAHVEDIHAVDLDALLNEALRMQDYRLAIRIRFLQALKLLSDRGLIQWEPGKTTREYLAELRSPELRSYLGNINRYFEYTWYGNFAATHELYQKVSNAFQNGKNKLA